MNIQKPSPFKYAIPAISWTLFFVFAVLIMTDALKVTIFKGVLLFVFFAVGAMSSLALISSDKQTPDKK